MNKHLASALGIAGAIIIAIIVSSLVSIGGLKLAGVAAFSLFGFLAFLVQWIAFIPAYLFQTEKYFDLVGSMTYIVLALAALMVSRQDAGSFIIAGMVIAWAIRLGSFLFVRVREAGEDSRFRTIKPDFLRFLMTWTLQGLWVLLTFAAGLAALTSGNPHGVDVFVVSGVVIWLTGFTIEVVADHQKARFRARPSNADQFIREGLWAWSRHPNYVGEILLWTGIAVAAWPALSGWQQVSLISPLFVYLLLTHVSGIRMLESKANKTWGQDPDYIEYRRTTPVLFPHPFAGRQSKN